ncbi:MAG: hypothetical protein D6732_12305 [Methanobacteriota archaeon]|nr:MAG: hypothetical protein D6732_12305 [Euryarchaeota archaeon]
MERKIILVVSCMVILIGLSGCLDKRDPVTVSTHPESWTSEGSPDFHGSVLLNDNLSLQSCRSCHGEDYQGGSSGVSCYTSGCHTLFPHPEGFADITSPQFHSHIISEQLGWDITGCRECHGDDYSGKGVADKNCRICHTAPEGPEACNNCHGNANNPAPPKDLHGNFSTSSPGVGAHQAHINDTTWTVNIVGSCQPCHKQPLEYEDEGHIDQGDGSEVLFGPEAFSDNPNLIGNTTWDELQVSCANVYCHGGFEFRRDDSAFPWGYSDSLIVGNNPTMIWTGVGTGQDICGSCHGLPPEGHIAAETCNTCHGRVVDENFNIVDKSLHINGEIEVF